MLSTPSPSAKESSVWSKLTNWKSELPNTIFKTNTKTMAHEMERRRIPMRQCRPMPLKSILRKSARSLCSDDESVSSAQHDRRRNMLRSVSFSGDFQSRWNEYSDSLSLEDTPPKQTLSPRMPVRSADEEDKNWKRKQAPRMPVRRATEDEPHELSVVESVRKTAKQPQETMKSDSLDSVFKVSSFGRREPAIKRQTAVSA
jgi:hypothetical protein